MRFFAIFTLFVCLIAQSQSCAQTGDWLKTDHVDTRLIAASQSEAALQIKLEDGWHTYWRNPGDSGLPPMLSWGDSENIKDVELHWPAPTRKKEFEFYTFGYDKGVIFPLTFQVEDPAKNSTLDLKAQIMICKDICIPQKFETSLQISGSDNREKEQAIIDVAKEKLPFKGDVGGLSIDSIVAAKQALVLNVSSEQGFENMDVFPVIEDDQIALTSPPQIETSDQDPQKAIIKITSSPDIENLTQNLIGKTLSVTLAHEGRAIEKSVQY